jgi:RNA polymerase primary sigma factor
MLAAGKWKPEKGVRFVQYAVWDIRRAIERAIDQQENIIHDAPSSVGFTNSRVDMVVAKTNRNIHDEIGLSSAGSELLGSLGCLNERERKVITLYYGLGTNALTMIEIAMEMGLKRERVRQIRKKAERKLRKPFSKMNNVK